MDAHLEAIPGLGTLTARGLASGDAEDLGGHADRASDLDVLALGTLDEDSADLLEVLDVAAGEGHADLEEVGLGGLDLLIGGHFFVKRGVYGGKVLLIKVRNIFIYKIEKIKL